MKNLKKSVSKAIIGNESWYFDMPEIEYISTPSLNTILVENWWTETYDTPFFCIFHVESEYITFKMIHWANLKGRQF